MQPSGEVGAENAKPVPASPSYTPQDLRSDIRAAELAIANINSNSSPDQILGLFSLLDRIVPAHEVMSQSGTDLRPEATRIETICGILNDKAWIINRVLAAIGGLAVLRVERDPPFSKRWWYLDQHIAKQKRDKRIRRARNVGLAIFVFALVAVIYAVFMSPGAETSTRIRLVSAAEADLQNGDYASALTNYQKAQALAPDDGEISLMIGVIYEVLGQLDDAERQYTKGIEWYETRATFMSERSLKYSALGWYDKALSDALQAIDLDRQFALGHCALATAYEGQNHYADAIAAFQTCADLAFEQGHDELYVLAKTRLARLMQMPR